MLFKKIIKYFCIVSSLIVVIMLLLLPHILENIITNKVIRTTGIKKFHMNVRSVGLSGIDLGEIEFGKTAEIDSIHINYNPRSLFNNNIDGIYISGLVVRVKLNGNRIEFPDSDITGLLSMGSNDTRKNHIIVKKHNRMTEQNIKFKRKIKNSNSKIIPETTLTPSLLPDKFFITNSSVIVTIGKSTFPVPFSINSTIKKTAQSIGVILHAFPFGERLDIGFAADIKKGVQNIEIGKVEIKADSFHLDQADKLISMYFPETGLTGNAAIKISKQTDSVWAGTISHIGIKKPFKAEISDFIFRISKNNRSAVATASASGADSAAVSCSASKFSSALKSFFVSGSFVLSDLMPASNALTYNHDSKKTVNFLSPVKIDYFGDYGINKENKNSWHCSLKVRNAESQKLLLESMGIAINIKDPVLNLIANGHGLKGNLCITGACLKGEGHYKSTRISFSKIKLSGKSDFDFTRAGNGLDFKFKTDSELIKLITNDFYSKFPGTKAFGSLHLGRNFIPVLAFKPVIHNATVKADRPDIKIKGIDLALPLSFPFNSSNPYPGDNKQGFFQVDRIIFKGNDMGSLKGKIIQNGYGGVIHGIAAITCLKKEKSNAIKINFKAEGSLKADNSGIQAGLQFNSNKIKISSDTINKSYLAPDSDINFHCVSIVKGKLELNNNRINTGLTLDITDGDLSLEKENVHASGIKTSLKFDDLISFRSAPGQILTIDKISSNNIKISRGIVKYSIESSHSFFIENASFHWCDGIVTTGSMRFSPNKNIYSIIFYCDRLKLSKILQQVGSFKAEGEGSLNGRIPVHYANGNLSFKNGFLFSTPGLGGKIKVQGTDALTAGIPHDSPEFIQIDLAREALKNYKYKWAKLVFNTNKDNLFVKMEFDGEPEKILPFEYNRELGRFMRVDVTNPGSHFQGMRIDVNLKLPFNRFMKFGGRLKKLLNR